MSKTEFIKPLADPVVSYIYSDAEHAGLAARSFIQAVIGRCNEKFGNVISVTPQKLEQSDVEHRAYRVDVQAKSDENQYANQEVQLYIDEALPVRNLMEAAQLFQRHSARGTSALELRNALPMVFAINICAHEPPNDGSSDYFRSAHFTYDQEPRDVVIPQFSLFEIQLRRFPMAEPNFADPLYCWTFMLYHMHINEMKPEEVLKMEPRVQTYYEQDEGIRQFCEQYGYAAADEHVREQYHRWTMENLRYLGEMSGARNQGFREGEEVGEARGLKIGIKQGEVQGHRNAMLIAAKNLLEMNFSMHDAFKATGVSIQELEQLAVEIELEQGKPEQSQGGMNLSM
jgi:hypothetical protein